jgi:elongation factor Ts
MAITADQVKKLREKTGAGMMDCKKALQKCDGDMEKALHHLREQGIAKATQKAARVAKEGLIFSDVRPQERLGVLLELNCETDFVARTEDFKSLAAEMSSWIVENRPREVTQLNESMKDRMNQTIAKLGENIAAKRFALLQREDKSAGIIHSYIHPGDKLGVLVHLKTGTDDAAGDPEFALLAKDVAMQVAATNPLVITRDRLSPEIIEKEKDIYRTQAKNEEKPEKIIERIVQGKLDKYFQEVCLLEQAFVKDQDRTVEERIAETGKKLDQKISVAQFVRFRLGDELA